MAQRGMPPAPNSCARPCSGCGRPQSVSRRELKGNPAATLAARKPKHCASSAFPSQPHYLDRFDRDGQRAPQTVHQHRIETPSAANEPVRGGSGNRRPTIEATVKRASVAAPSAADSPRGRSWQAPSPKSSRSSDLGGGDPKYGWATRRSSTSGRRGRSAPACHRDRTAGAMAGHPVVQWAISWARIERQQAPSAPIQVTFATPPIFRTASGLGRSAANAPW